MRTGAVIAAAGLSSRMGAFKPMLEIGDTTAVRRIITVLRSVGADPIVLVTGHRAEGALGRLVVRANGGTQAHRALLLAGAIHQIVQKSRREALATLIRIDTDLPHEDRVGLGGAEEAGDEADHTALDLDHHRTVGELGAPQNVGVRRVQIEDSAVAGDFPHAVSVCRGWRTENRVGRIRGTGYFSFSWVHNCPPP